MTIRYKRYTKNFSTKDFPLGVPSHRLLERLQSARESYGKPIIINSGGRTNKHNKKVGGAPGSSHIMKANSEFDAADIKCTTSRQRHEMLPHLIIHFTRIGIYPTHLHVDADMSKAQGVTWVK